MIEEKDLNFLKSYDIREFERPSVTVDILIFSMNSQTRTLQVLLIQRDIPPFEGKWALPGGFVGFRESLETAARRKLLEETGIEDIPLEQLYTFGDVDRDPRTRVISVAYFALVPGTHLNPAAGAGAQKAELIDICCRDGQIRIGEGIELAFDHRKILETAIRRLQGKLSYTLIAFRLLKDKNRFAIYELQKIHEAILGQELDTANFRRMFHSMYVNPGLVQATGEECREYSRRASQYYRFCGDPDQL